MYWWKYSSWDNGEGDGVVVNIDPGFTANKVDKHTDQSTIQLQHFLCQ